MEDKRKQYQITGSFMPDKDTLVISARWLNDDRRFYCYSQRNQKGIFKSWSKAYNDLSTLYKDINFIWES